MKTAILSSFVALSLLVGIAAPAFADDCNSPAEKMAELTEALDD